MKALKITGLLWLLPGCFQFLMAQTEGCDLKLKRANDYFTFGQLEIFEDSTVASLLSCAHSSFTPYQQVEAYRLLTVEALLNQNPDLADGYFTKLLRVEPEFKLDLTQQTDPAELIYLYHDFRTRPLICIDYYAGINDTRVQGGERLSTDGETLYVPDYLSRPGLFAGASVFVPLFNRNLGFVSGLNFAQRNFSYSDILSGVTANSFTFSFTERESWLELPVMLRYDFDYLSRYNFKRRQLVPLVEAGVNIGWLFRSTFFAPTLDFGSSETVTDPVINVKEIRQPFQLFLNTGAGFKYKWKTRYFFLKARYTVGLFDQAKAADPNSQLVSTLFGNYGYQDVKFSIDGLGFCFGFEQTLYYPKRMKPRF